jgi:hypothetical protein
MISTCQQTTQGNTMTTIEVLKLARLALEHTATHDEHENYPMEELAMYALDVLLEQLEATA